MSRDYLVASSVVVGFAMLSLAIYFGLAHREATSSRASDVSVNALKATEPTPPPRPSSSTLPR